MQDMDSITTAIIAALSAGAAGGLTEASKTAITDAYSRLKDLLAKKFGAKSKVIQAMDELETKPESSGRKQTLEEEIIAINVQRDADVLAVAQQLIELLDPEQAATGKFTLKNYGLIQGLQQGDGNTQTNTFS